MIQKLTDPFCASLLTTLYLPDNLHILCHCHITSISWIFCSYCDIHTSIQNFTIHYLSAYTQILHNFHFTLHYTEHYLSEVSYFTQLYYYTHFVKWYWCCSNLKHFQGHYSGTISTKLKSRRQRILQKHDEIISIYIFFK